MDKITFLAFLTPFILFFQQVRGFFKSALSFFIRNDKIIGFCTDDRMGFVAHMIDRSLYIPFGNVKYDQFRIYSTPRKHTELETFKFRTSFFMLYKYIFPVFIKPTGGILHITYPNVFSLEKILADYHEILFEKHIISDEEKPSRFSVTYHKGKSLKNKQGSDSGGGAFRSGSLETSPPNNSTSGGSVEGGFSSVNLNFPQVIPPLRYKRDEMAWDRPQTKRSKYYFSPEGDEMYRQVESWYEAEKWYSDRQINWKRGSILLGKHGTGKSELIKKIAEKLKIPLHVFDLSSMDNNEFQDGLDCVSYGSIILFEDLDCVFEGRVNRNQKDNSIQLLTFDFFINKLSGSSCISDVFVFATTNHIDKLDEALIRPGRFDIRLELPSLSIEGKRFIAGKMLDLWPEEIDIVVTDADETVAEFENKCSKRAIERFWQDNHK